MKFLFSVILFLFTISVALSQDTIFLKGEHDTLPISRKEAIYYKVTNKNVLPTEVQIFYMNGVKVSKYHVDSINLNVYQGEYESYYYKGGIQSKGVFKDDRMQGPWVIYDKDKNFIEKKINYKENHKEGRSYTFYDNGKLKRMDVYVRDTIVLSTCYDSTGKGIVCEQVDYSEILGRAETMPEFPGGVQALFKYLAYSIKPQIKSREMGLQGKVTVKFYIDEEGFVKEPVILSNTSGSDEYAQETMRVVLAMPRWTPGKQKGKPVKAYYTLPVTFKVE